MRAKDRHKMVSYFFAVPYCFLCAIIFYTQVRDLQTFRVASQTPRAALGLAFVAWGDGFLGWVIGTCWASGWASVIYIGLKHMYSTSKSLVK